MVTSEGSSAHHYLFKVSSVVDPLSTRALQLPPFSPQDEDDEAHDINNKTNKSRNST